MAKKEIKKNTDKSNNNDKSSTDIASIMSQMLKITKLLDERIDLMRDRIDVVNTRLDAFGTWTEAINAKLTKVAGRLGI